MIDISDKDTIARKAIAQGKIVLKKETIQAIKEGKIKKDDYENLSLREREVFLLLAEGKAIKEIAEVLFISRKTVESHKYNIMEKLHVNTVTDLTKIAIRKNLIQL